MIAALAVAAVSTVYTCEIEMPRHVVETPTETKLMPISLPPEFSSERKFSIRMSQGKSDDVPQATVLWPGDPINVAGEYPALPTAPGAFTLMAFSSGPCLFTEQACATTMQVVEQGTGAAKLLILPSALVTDSTNKARSPFVVVIEGQCDKRTDK